MTPSPDPTAILRADRQRVLDELDRADSQERLVDFIRLTWSILEPARQFIHGWAVDAICEHLQAVTDGSITKLLVNVPPGCMKSLTTNVFWPAWEWGPRNHPSYRYIGASYSEALTVRDNRRCRALIGSALYQRLWGDRFRVDPGQDAKIRFDNDAKGFKIATSVGGLGTGERGDRFIIDDPHNVKEGESELKREEVLQWFTEVVPTRVNDAGKSAIIVIMQRVHEQDVSGLILAKELGYTYLCLPMEYEPDRACSTSIGFRDPRTLDGELLWPERFPKKYLEEDLKPSLRAWGGTYAEAGQLQQRPTPRGGGLFQRRHFQFLDHAPSPKQTAKRVRGWDLAATKDGRGAYTVGLKMSRTHDGKIVIEDVRRIRGSPGEVEQLITSCAAADGVSTQQDLPQDPGQAGKAQKAHLANSLQGYVFHFSPESGSKEDRARPLASQAEAGNVYVVRAPWNDAFLAEVSMFPNGEFKDQVDAASRAYARLISRRVNLVGAAPETIKAPL